MLLLLPNPLCGMSDPTPADVLNAAIEAHWKVVARHAYTQYERRGRGVIVLPTPTEADGEGRAPLRYLTFSSSGSDLEGSALQPLHNLVQTYTPDTQVVVALELPGGRTVFDVYERMPSPVTLATEASEE